MKYGLVIDFGQSFCNYGDLVQSTVIESIFSKMRVPPDQIIRLTKKNLAEYDGEPLILPFSYTIFYLIDFASGKPLLSEKIIPIFLGVSIESIFVYNCISLDDFARADSPWLELFRKSAPIGCRDHYTLRFMEDHGISAYLQGCITNTIPRRANGDYNKTFLVDCPESVIQHVPPRLLKNAEVMSNVEPVGNLSVEDNYQRVIARYEYYKNNAALVVTSRYHVALPCNAMGIPSIVIIPQISKHSADIRWDTIPPQIQICVSESEYGDIDWTRAVHDDFSDFKETILTMAALRIQEANIRYGGQGAIREFFAARLSEYDKIKHRHTSYAHVLESFVRSHHAKSRSCFYIWGANDVLCHDGRIALVETVMGVNPNLAFSGWIDSFKTGKLAEKEIRKIDDITLEIDDFIIVCAESAVNYALSRFAEMGLCEWQFIVLSDRTLRRSE